MDRLIYTAMVGATELAHAQAVNNNNLANATTGGFRSDFAVMVSEQVATAGLQSRHVAITSTPATSFRPGDIETTGRPLDLAIEERGWFAVDPGDGSEAYSRSGSLRIDPNGFLRNARGEMMLGNSGPIVVPPDARIDIGADGSVSILGEGGGLLDVAVVDRLRLVNPEGGALIKGSDGLFRLGSGELAEPDGSVRVVSGALEGSNVNTMEAMARMIQLARQFEMQVNMMKTAEENAQSSSSLLSIR